MAKPKHVKRGPDSYEDFLRSLGSVILGIGKCSANLDRELHARLQNRKKSSERRILLNFKLDHVSESYFDVEASIRVAVREKVSGKEALTVECTVQGHFHGQKPINKEYAARFVSSELRVVVWPYFRQFISDTTGRMAIRPLFIPVYMGQALLNKGVTDKKQGYLSTAVQDDGERTTGK